MAYILQTGHQCFPACFYHPTEGDFDVSLTEKTPLVSDYTLGMGGGGEVLRAGFGREGFGGLGFRCGLSWRHLCFHSSLCFGLILHQPLLSP